MNFIRSILFKSVSALLMAQFAWAEPETKPGSAPSSTGEVDSNIPEDNSFETTGRYKVFQDRLRGPEIVADVDWPKIEPPTKFNYHFDKPQIVWRLESGYFAFFSGGEWGGGFFYVERNGKEWIRIIDMPLDDECSCEQFEGDLFLVAAGDSNTNNGEAHLVSRTANGEWKSQKVFDS